MYNGKENASNIRYILYNNIIQFVNCRRKAFSIFILSRRGIEFFQKNITQLNVVNEINVFDHRSNNKNCLPDNSVSEAKRKAIYI